MSQPPDPKPSDHILERISREAREYRASGRKFLAVFDLDSTLFDLSLRVATIVDHFSQAPENRGRYPEECELLRNIKILPTDWGLGEPLNRIGITETTHQDFCHQLHQFWAKGFFSDHYLKHDEPLPGAVNYVESLRADGADIMYLTGRDIPRMLDGTRASLLARGFPINETNASLILKPVAKLDDARFKADVLADADRKYDRIWLFENEPVNLNLIARELPSIGLVFIDSVHSGREQLEGTLARIVHFEVRAEDFL